MRVHPPAAVAEGALPPSTADMGPWMQPGAPGTLDPKIWTLKFKCKPLQPSPCPINISPAWAHGHHVTQFSQVSLWMARSGWQPHCTAPQRQAGELAPLTLHNHSP